MILKARHLYRAELKDSLWKNKRDRRYVLTFPVQDTEVKLEGYYMIKSFAHIDITGKYNEHSSIGFGDSFTFKEPTFNDVFEIIGRMKERRNYRYNFRTNEIEKIKTL